MIKATLRTDGGDPSEDEVASAIEAGWEPQVADGPGSVVVVNNFETAEDLVSAVGDLELQRFQLLEVSMDDDVSQVYNLVGESGFGDLGGLGERSAPSPAHPQPVAAPTPSPAGGGENEADKEKDEVEEPAPAPPAAPAPEKAGPVVTGKASDLGLIGVPSVPEMVWDSLAPADKKILAKELVVKATEFSTNRQLGASWGHATRETALLAHLEPEERRAIAVRLLEQQGGLSEQQMRSETLANDFQLQRVILMRQAVAAAAESNQHLRAWRELSKKVVPFLVATTVFGVMLVLVALDLVRQGKLDGLETALLVFIFAIMAVSPATLLLIGRPLEGLDKWRPGSTEKETGKPETAAGGVTDKEKPAPNQT